MMSSIKLVEDYFKSGKSAWFELDIDFDLYHAQQEIKNIEKFYVEHRDGENHNGWSSCCLRGLAIDKTLSWQHYASNEFDVTYSWTSLAELAPSITNFWKNVFPVQEYKRVRFMKLDPGGEIKMHRDFDPELISGYDMCRDDIAINLAITHPPECSMIFENQGVVPWAAGKVIMLNVSQNHCVVNSSQLSRVHMIAHAVIGNRKEEFNDLLSRSYKNA